jgi:NADPH:quinone reductase-like Zn-dependent oxidoreductase
VLRVRRGARLGPFRDGGGIAVVRGWDDRPAERDNAIHAVRGRGVLERTDWLEELRAFASDGRITLRVAGEYRPEQAAEAQEIMDAGGLRGRVVLVF